jgi:trk system potassium uptake protein TrkH
VNTGLDNAPAGVLLWRSLLNWIGGIGIIVIAMSVLPMLKVGGMQLFKMESSINQRKSFQVLRNLLLLRWEPM